MEQLGFPLDTICCTALIKVLNPAKPLHSNIVPQPPGNSNEAWPKHADARRTLNPKGLILGF